jgi:Protein of unknown function (DUF2281)
MTNEEIIREFAELPPDAQREAENFISFLRERYKKKSENLTDFAVKNDSFVGMWKNREDMHDSSTFVRELRQREWTK